MLGRITKTECVRTASLEAHQYSGTNSTLYATVLVLEKFNNKFQRLTRLLDLSPFATFTPDEMTRLVLVTPLQSAEQILNRMDYRGYPNL